MELKLTTTYDRRFIKQSWDFEPHPDLGFDVSCQIQQRMVDTEDAALRQALINMGWTPPEQSNTLIAALLRINEDVWPLVHGLTSRQTLRDFMRTLPDIINWRQDYATRTDEGTEVQRPIPKG